MKKFLFAMAIVAFGLMSCGGEKTGENSGDSTHKDTTHTTPPPPDSIGPADTTSRQSTGGDSTDRQASWAANPRGTIVANLAGGKLDVLLPEEVLKVRGIEGFLKDGMRVTRGWVETAPGGKFYLMVNARGADGVITVARELVASGNNVILPEKGYKINVCESKDCTECQIQWTAQGAFSKCACKSDSRQNCKHTAHNR